MPFTYILCQSNWHVYISTNFQNVNKPSTLHSYLQNKFLASKSSLILWHMYCKLDTAIIDITRSFESEYNNSPYFEIYTENRCMGTLSLAIAYRQKYQQQGATGQKLGLLGSISDPKWLEYSDLLHLRRNTEVQQCICHIPVNYLRCGSSWYPKLLANL